MRGWQKWTSSRAAWKRFVRNILWNVVRNIVWETYVNTSICPNPFPGHVCTSLFFLEASWGTGANPSETAMWHKLSPFLFHVDLRVSVYSLLGLCKGLRLEERCFEAGAACCYALSRLHRMFDLRVQKPWHVAERFWHQLLLGQDNIKSNTLWPFTHVIPCPKDMCGFWVRMMPMHFDHYNDPHHAGPLKRAPIGRPGESCVLHGNIRLAAYFPDTRWMRKSPVDRIQKKSCPPAPLKNFSRLYMIFPGHERPSAAEIKARALATARFVCRWWVSTEKTGFYRYLHPRPGSSLLKALEKNVNQIQQSNQCFLSVKGPSMNNAATCKVAAFVVMASLLFIYQLASCSNACLQCPGFLWQESRQCQTWWHRNKDGLRTGHPLRCLRQSSPHRRLGWSPCAGGVSLWGMAGKIFKVFNMPIYSMRDRESWRGSLKDDLALFHRDPWLTSRIVRKKKSSDGFYCSCESYRIWIQLRWKFIAQKLRTPDTIPKYCICQAQLCRYALLVLWHLCKDRSLWNQNDGMEAEYHTPLKTKRVYKVDPR